jgi:hypothetical protein
MSHDIRGLTHKDFYRGLGRSLSNTLCPLIDHRLMYMNGTEGYKL